MLETLTMLEQQLHNLLKPEVENLGFRLVQVKFGGTSGKYKALQIFAEKPGYIPLTVGDCQGISRVASLLLDAEDMIKDRYMLEVSSPGMDRQLFTPEDYKRFEGFIVSVKLKRPVEGSKKYKGRYKISADNAGITINSEEHKREFNLNYEDIETTKIVITDELFKSKGERN